MIKVLHQHEGKYHIADPYFVKLIFFYKDKKILLKNKLNP
jgi:hypothetical protein